MKSKSGVGIICDYCNMICENDFVYGSFDIFNRSDAVGSYDFCVSCMDKFAKLCISNYNPKVKVCEVTGRPLDNSKYMCKVSRVDVNMSNSQYKCIKCKSIMLDAVCECGNNTGFREATCKVDGDFLQFTMCNDAYASIVNHIGQIMNMRDQ